MKTQTPPRSQPVVDALRAAGIDTEVRTLPASTRTASEAAVAIGCEVAQIAKSLVFRGAESDIPVLIITSGSNRVDEGRARAFVGENLVRADARYVRDHTGFAIGGIPPVGHLHPIRTWFDADLREHDAVWAAAGTPNAVFRLRREDLLRLAGDRFVRVS